jgi:tape measure domain-containing protein
MAGISTSVKVKDGVSSPFRAMTSAINICLSSFEQMQNATAQAVDTAAIQDARFALNSMNEEAAQLADGLGEAASGQNSMNREINSGEGAAGRLLKRVVGIAAAYASLETVKKAIGISDELTQTTARLSMIVRDGENIQDIQNKIALSANAARGSYFDMGSAVAKLGNNARDAFGNTDEIIAFAELIQKQFAIAGASTSESSNAMLQLTQAMGSGVLRGDELNSIFENAPNIIQNIADYLDVPIGEIRNMASEGSLTADIIKAAMFSASDDITDKFASMPMTWEQMGTSISNAALQAFTPVLTKINEIANSEKFRSFVNDAIGAMYGLANVANGTLDLLIGGASFVYDNWSVIQPVILGVAAVMGVYTAAIVANNIVQGLSNTLKTAAAISAVAHGTATAAEAASTVGMTAAQLSFNAALYACPLVWILLIIIAVIAALYGIVAAINKVTGSSISATGIIMGALYTAFAYIYNNFAALLELVLGIVNYWYNIFAEFANFFANCFENPVSSIIYLFQGLTDTILGFIQKIAEAIDFVFGSNLSSTVAGWRTSLQAAADSMVAKYAPNENYTKVVDNINLSAKDLGFQHMDYPDAWDMGYAVGQGLDNKFKGMFGAPEASGDDYEDLWNNIGDSATATASNTGKVADSLEITDENLAYLRDIAEREIIDRTVFTTIQVDMGGVTNTVNNMSDLDGVADYISTTIQEQMAVEMEGV